MASNVTRFPPKTPPAMAAEALAEMHEDKPIAFVLAWLTVGGDVKVASYAGERVANMLAEAIADGADE